MQIVDAANSPLFQGRQYGIVNEQSGYMAISQCKFAENTKSLAYNAVIRRWDFLKSEYVWFNNIH